MSDSLYFPLDAMKYVGFKLAALSTVILSRYLISYSYDTWLPKIVVSNLTPLICSQNLNLIFSIIRV
jgi:hypothetical protein